MKPVGRTEARGEKLEWAEEEECDCPTRVLGEERVAQKSTPLTFLFFFHRLQSSEFEIAVAVESQVRAAADGVLSKAPSAEVTREETPNRNGTRTLKRGLGEGRRWKRRTEDDGRGPSVGQ
ncbi:hypothetical protein B296_00046092 [Ensete ventricosum]|uniref:Uncharacterized protein n=1 Tax=Ensete ventricosum TaxID=4639 RepID=A0A426Y832_ENSVE|nr:hypothetical protein B296_00046092 [Ensete ventricosum]